MAEENTQITLRETIQNAMNEHAPQDDVQESSIARDEQGRFKAKEQEETVTPDVTPEPTQTIEAPQVKPRPSSWKKDYEEHWTKLDPTLQDYIAQREADYAKGVSTYKQNWETAAPIYEAMQPFLPLLQQHNLQPQQWISNLGNAHKLLALGSEQEKLQAFAKLATDYGVPLQALTGQGYDPQQSLLMQELNQIKSQFTEFQTLQQKQEEIKLQNEIEAFKANAPYFDDVRETMSQLLQSGVASDLKTAYDKAIRLHDEVWQKTQAEALQANTKVQAEQNQQKVAQAKAKAVSTKSSTPTGLMSGGNGKKDLRSIIAEQVMQYANERV